MTVKTVGLGSSRPAPPLTSQRIRGKSLNSLHQTPPETGVGVTGKLKELTEPETNLLGPERDSQLGGLGSFLPRAVP